MWIKIFHEDRTFQAKVGKVFSTVYYGTNGAPQRECFPIIAFNFTHELLSHITSFDVSCEMYADDIIIYRRISDWKDEITLRKAIDYAQNWDNLNNISLAAEKSKLLTIVGAVLSPLKPYKICVRSVVENGATVLYPSKKKDIDVIESVKNNFTYS